MTLTDEQARDLMVILDDLSLGFPSDGEWCASCQEHIYAEHGPKCLVTIARELKAAIEGKE